MPRQPTSPAAIPLWLLWQLAALALAAFRIPLWSRYPAPAEQEALALMLVAQIAASALLFPILLNSAGSTLITIALAWPICELASFLADADPKTFAVGELYVSAWLFVLYLWNRFTSNILAPGLLASMVALLTFGGPLLTYIHAEFNNNSAQWLWPHATLLGPIVGVLSQIQTGSSQFDVWLALFILAAIAPLTFLLRKTFLPPKSI